MGFSSARWFQGYSQADNVFFLESSSVMRKARTQVCRPSIAVIPVHHTLAAKVVAVLIPQGWGYALLQQRRAPLESLEADMQECYMLHNIQ